MSDISNEVMFRVGGVLHEARMAECFGKTDFSFRKKWPVTLKDFRRQMMDGQSWIDVAMAQVRALVEAGLLIESAPGFKAPQNTAESDPVVTPDCPGVDTLLRS